MSSSPMKSPSKFSTATTSPSPKKPSPSRQLSNNSQQALNQLNYLDSYFNSFTSRVENIDRSINLKDPQSLLKAKHELAQIIGDLESLQENEIDGLLVNELDTGKEEALLHKKHLNAEVESMLEQTQLLYKQIDATLQRLTMTSSSSSSSDSPKYKNEPPLRREEIAKLLLLSSRAHSIQQISFQQWRNIKDEICRRKGYLRQILRQSDISSVMTALANIELSS